MLPDSFISQVGQRISHNVTGSQTDGPIHGQSVMLRYAGGGVGEGGVLSLVFSTNRINKYGTQCFCHRLAQPLSTNGHKTVGLESSLYSPQAMELGGWAQAPLDHALGRQGSREMETSNRRKK